MSEEQLCTIYIGCPHCYCTSSNGDSDAGSVYLCRFRRCPHCYCTSDDTMSSNEDSDTDMGDVEIGDTMSSNEDSDADMGDVEIGQVHVKVEVVDMGGAYGGGVGGVEITEVNVKVEEEEVVEEEEDMWDGEGEDMEAGDSEGDEDYWGDSEQEEMY